MVNFGQLTAEICWRAWGTPANFNGFGVFTALLHGILVVGISQILRRFPEGATYIRQGGHHVGVGPHSSFNLLLYILLISRDFKTMSFAHRNENYGGCC